MRHNVNTSSHVFTNTYLSNIEGQKQKVYIITRDTNEDNQIILVFSNYKEGLNKFNFIKETNQNDKFSYTEWDVE